MPGDNGSDHRIWRFPEKVRVIAGTALAVIVLEISVVASNRREGCNLMIGNRAKQFTSQLVFRKLVEVEPVTTDRYGRTVAFIRVENVIVNKELIKEGLAWVYLPYCTLPLCSDRWDGLELEARFGKRDLWGESGEVPPLEFRRHHQLLSY